MKMKSQHLQAKGNTRSTHKTVFQRTVAPQSVSASTQSTSSVGPICPTDNGTTYTTAHKQPYELYCDTDFRGGDLPTVHAESYTQCIEQCDSYLATKNQTDGALCVASVYWASNPNNGNCYLKYEVPFSNVAMNNSLVQGARRVQYSFNGGPLYVPFIVAPTRTSGQSSIPAPALETTSAPQTLSTPSRFPQPTLGPDTKIAIGVSIAVIGLALVIIPILCFRKKRDGDRYEQSTRIVSSERSPNSDPPNDIFERKGYVDVLEAVGRTTYGDNTIREIGSICELPGQLSPQLDPRRIHEEKPTAPLREDSVIVGETERVSSQVLDTIMEVTEDQTASRSSSSPIAPLKIPPATPPKTYHNLPSVVETVIGPVSPMGTNFAHFGNIRAERSPVSSPEPSPRAIAHDENALSPTRRHELVSKAKRSRTITCL